MGHCMQHSHGFLEVSLDRSSARREASEDVANLCYTSELVFVICAAAAAGAKAAKAEAGAAAAKAAKGAAAAAGSRTKARMFLGTRRITVAILAQGAPSYFCRSSAFLRELEPQRVRRLSLQQKPDCHTECPTPEVPCLPLRLSNLSRRTPLSAPCAVDVERKRSKCGIPPSQQPCKNLALLPPPLPRQRWYSCAEAHSDCEAAASKRKCHEAEWLRTEQVRYEEFASTDALGGLWSIEQGRADETV